MPVQRIPDGYTGVTPYLIVRDAAQALDFYRQAFGATETMRLTGPDGVVGHAEFRIGQGAVMLAQEMPGYSGPQTLGGTPVSMHFYTEDVDALYARAVAAGATAKRPVEDQFYGDRAGTLVDPFGHIWMLATHIEDVSDDEMQRRFMKLYGGGE